MSEEIIVKRLHVSGLTPAINSADLSQRLGSFGTVKSLDGFGMLDALGQPRKFAYVTIETTKSKLARCMNLLSGVTWKGAKLRLGEAKPDFHERIAKENAKAAEETGEPPRKKRRLPRGVQGIHAEDMSPVTLETVTDHKGWKMTPLGRIIYPIKMRPSHPLPDPMEISTDSKAKKSAVKSRKRKLKEPSTRARRRTIDPTKWGSKHVKGAFLDAVVAYPDSFIDRSRSQSLKPNLGTHAYDAEESSSDESTSNGPVAATFPVSQLTEQHPPSPRPQHATGTAQPALLNPTPKLTAAVSPLESELLQEKNASLGLLQSLFGGQTDWGGEETLSDVDVDEIQQAPLTAEADIDFEVVPRSLDEEVLKRKNTEDTLSPSKPTMSPPAHAESPPTQAGEVSSKPKLKDLFAHRKEEGGFSLLGHLDLVDELEEDVPDLGFAQAHTIQAIEEPTSTAVSTRPTHAGFLTLDTKQPLFFPVSAEERAHIKGKVRDIFDLAKEMGIDWRSFCRTDTEEQIKERWEQNKKELTQEWKRRHREAIKSKRRRGGYDGGAE